MDKINLNTASVDELKKLMDEDQAKEVMENRPYISWDHFKEKTGFDDDVLSDIQEMATIA